MHVCSLAALFERHKTRLQIFTLITHVVCCMCFAENICYTLLMCIVSKWFVCFTVLLSINHKASFAFVFICLWHFYSAMKYVSNCLIKQDNTVTLRKSPILFDRSEIFVIISSWQWWSFLPLYKTLAWKENMIYTRSHNIDFCDQCFKIRFKLIKNFNARTVKKHCDNITPWTLPLLIMSAHSFCLTLTS